MTSVNFTMTACAACSTTSETDEGMIACDSCNKWYHYRCVGVKEASIRDQEKWFCPTEKCQKVEEEQAKQLEDGKKKGKSSKKTLVTDENSDKSSAMSDRQSGSSLEKKLKALEKEQRAKEKEIEAERLLREKKMEMDRVLKEKRLQMENEMRKREMEQEKELLEKALKDEQDHLVQLELMRGKYRAKMEEVKYKLNSSKVAEKGLKNEENKLDPQQRNSKPTKPMQKKNAERMKKTKCPGSGKKKEKKPLSEDEVTEEESEEEESSSEEEDSEEEDDSEESEETCEESESESEEEEIVKRKKNCKKVVPHGLGQPSTGPTKAQLAARNGISRKLPIFTGKPEEWPLFIGSYEASNEACGYNDVENLVRLQECLKGSALESVRGQLLLPRSVPKVIENLRQLYGRPEQLLHYH